MLTMTVINQSGKHDKTYSLNETPNEFAWTRLYAAGYRGSIDGFITALEQGETVHCEQFGITVQKEARAMSTYKINIENTGLDSNEQVERMAQLMQRDGYDVECLLTTFGNINPDTECPVSDDDWQRYLTLATEENKAMDNIKIEDKQNAIVNGHKRTVFTVREFAGLAWVHAGQHSVKGHNASDQQCIDQYLYDELTERPE